MANNGVIDLPGGADIVLQPENSQNFTSLTIQRVIALPQQKKIVAFVKGVGKRLTLYEGAEYDALNGQISMQDVETKVKEALGVASSSSP